MALQGFDSSYYLNAKLTALQATESEWALKDTAFLETVLQNVYGLTAEEHYTQYGYAEGLAPNAYFNAAEYKLAKATAMFDAGLYLNIESAQAAFEAAWTGDAYQHYLQYGAAEGINPSNAFDESSYLASKLAALQADTATATEWAGKTVADVEAAFTAAGLTALGHYVAYGATEGIAVTAVPAGEQVTPDTPAASNPGETFTLTTGIDDITGTSGDDIVDGMLDGTFDTFSVADSINGGAGTDILRIVSDQTSFDAGLADVTNVETLKYYNKGAVALATIDLDSDGFTSLILDKADAAGGGLGISGLDSTTSVQVGDLYGNLMTITYADAGGTGDSASITIGDAITGSGVVAAGMETVSVTMTGAATTIDTGTLLAAATTININAGDDADDAQEFSGFTTAANAVVNITGKGDLDLGTLAATIKTVNAADSEGGITATTNAAQTAVTGGAGDDDLTLVSPTAKLAVATGAGDDTVNISLFDTIAGKIDGTDVTIDGGAGTLDVLISDEANFTTAALIANVNKTSNFEVLAGTAVVTALDADDYDDINIFSFSGNLAVSNFTTESEDTIALTGATTTTLTVTPVLDSGNDIVNLILDADAASATHASITVNKMETVNIESIANSALTNTNTITLLTVQNNTEINITGDADLDMTTATGTELTVIGSSATGDLDITVVAGNDTITTGSGDDTIDGAAGIDTIVAGAGDDSITGGAGDDILTGGTGQDTFVFVTATDGMDTIKDFTAGTGGDIYDTDFATENDFVVDAIDTAAGSVKLDTSTGGVFVVDGTLRASITDYTDGAEVIAAISDAGLTIDAAADKALLALTDGGNTYVYEVIEASAGTTIEAAEITLVGVWEGVTATNLVDANFA